MKRNAVVAEITDAPWALYGRITRLLGGGLAEIIDSRGHLRRVPLDALEPHAGYRGYWDMRSPLREAYPVFRRMPSLRKLKQMASRTTPSVFRKNRSRTVTDAHGRRR